MVDLSLKSARVRDNAQERWSTARFRGRVATTLLLERAETRLTRVANLTDYLGGRRACLSQL
jgi:hypothetical protein